MRAVATQASAPPSRPFPRQLAQQPGARHPPVALHDVHRDGHDLRRLLDCQPPEVAKLHDAVLAGVDPREVLERLVESQHFDAVPGRRHRHFVERETHHLPPALRRRSLTGVIHEDPPHDLGAECQEVRAVLAADAPCPHQLEVRLVREAGRLEASGSLRPGELPVREAPQLRVQEVHEEVQRPCIAILPRGEHRGDLRLALVRHFPARMLAPIRRPPPGRLSHTAASPVHHFDRRFRNTSRRRHTMSHRVVRTLCLAVLCLAVAAAAWAQHQPACSQKRLAGAWGYTMTGTSSCRRRPAPFPFPLRPSARSSSTPRASWPAPSTSASLVRPARRL